MINIMDLLKKRAEYPIMRDSDSWMEEVLESETKDEVWVITGSLQRFAKKYTERITSKYAVAGAYNIGEPFYNTRIRMELLHLINQPQNGMNVGIYKGRMHVSPVKKANKDGLVVYPEALSEKYKTYITKLEKWINEGILPENDESGAYEFNQIKVEDFSGNRLMPEFYSKKAMQVRSMLKKDKVVKLSDVAEVILPRPIRNEMGKVILPSNFRYPFEIETVQEKNKTTVMLQTGDILLPVMGNAKAFFASDQFTDTLYVSQYVFVIRCKTDIIAPEYLFLYLNSEVRQIVFEMLNKGSYISRLSLADAKNLPVVLPTVQEQKIDIYKRQAYALTHAERAYKYLSTSADWGAAYTNTLGILSQKTKAESIDDILDMELLSTMKVHSTNQLQELLKDDWKELNACYKTKAYKATLILAGSILEAVLIDWLSEIDNKDYFEEDYYVTDRKGNRKRADLINYIDAIKCIEHPHWIDEATKSHEIRKKRNLVHAKLGINSNDINEETCKMVIGYLKDVIRTRGVESE